MIHRIIFLFLACNFPRTVSSEGSSSSWFDGIEFEDYKPSSAQNLLPPRHPLQIPCGLIVNSDDLNEDSNTFPLRTVLDTSLSTSIISSRAVQSSQDLLKLVVRGNGQQSRVWNPFIKKEQIIPSGKLLLRMGSTVATVPAPSLCLNDDSETFFDLRLGMDFLASYQGIINLRSGEITILLNDEDIAIPIITRKHSPIDEL